MELAYIFDITTKELIGSTQYFNKDEEGNPQLPPDYTMVVPNESREGYAQIYDGSTWSYIIDRRGTEYWLPGDRWDTDPHRMKELGELPTGATTTRPEKPQSEIDEEELEAIRNRREKECFAIINRGNLWYQKYVNTPQRQEELSDWYEAWLHITDSKPYIIPKAPIWINPENED